MIDRNSSPRAIDCTRGYAHPACNTPAAVALPPSSPTLLIDELEASFATTMDDLLKHRLLAAPASDSMDRQGQARGD
jgi:hypothetical protein